MSEGAMLLINDVTYYYTRGVWVAADKGGWTPGNASTFSEAQEMVEAYYASCS